MLSSNGIENSMGVPSLFSVVVAVFSIGAAWWALQSLRFESLVRMPGSGQAKVLHLLLAIVLGHQVAKFIIDYLSWSLNIQ